MINTPSKAKGRGGFTLIEAMVAAAVLSVGILAALDMVAVSLAAKMKSKDMVIANSLAKQVMEDAKNVGYSKAADNMKLHNVTNTDGTVIYSYAAPVSVTLLPNLVRTQVVTAVNKQYTITLTENEGVPVADLAKVVVKVTWRVSNIEHSVVYTTYATKI